MSRNAALIHEFSCVVRIWHAMSPAGRQSLRNHHHHVGITTTATGETRWSETGRFIAGRSTELAILPVIAFYAIPP